MYNWTPSVVASSCTVATSAVGLAFAQPDPQARPDARLPPRTSLPLESAVAETMAPRTRPSQSSHAPLSYPSHISPSSRDQPRNDSSPARPSYDGRTWSGKVRRLTGGDISIQRRFDHERSSTSGSDAVGQEPRPRPLTARSRSRNSFMKRWSTTSYDNSRSSSPWPAELVLSPSSNASASISNAGSHIPMIGSLPAPQERNRLVKRTTSQRQINGAAKAPTLRRPATSHQRSAELESWSRMHQRDSMSVTPDLLPPAPRAVPSTEARWKSFFTVRVNKNGGTKGSEMPAQSFRRIVPDQGHYPTLVSTKAIVTSGLDVNDYPEYDTDSVFFSSRPPSAFGLDQLTRKRDSSTVEQSNPSEPERSATQHDDSNREASPRRSFSSLLSRKPSRRGSIRDTVANKLSKRMGRRVVSEPTSTAGSKHQLFASDSDSFADANQHQGVSRSARPNVTSRTDANSPLISHASTTPTLNDQYSPNVAQFDRFAGASLVNNNEPPTYQPRHSYNSVVASETTSSTETDTWMEEFEAGAATHGHYAIMGNGRPRTSRTSRSRRNSESRFETIPDESPPKQSTPQLKTVLPMGMDVDTIEEESYMGSPSRTIRSDRADNGSPFISRISNRSPLPSSVHLPSSPPEFAKPLNLGSLEYDDPGVDEDEESRWSGLDEQDSVGRMSDVDEWDAGEQVATPVPLRRSSPFHVDFPSGSRQVAISVSDGAPTGTKSTLFSYSEKSAENPAGSSSPPRPKTVHGKKDADGRGSRSNKRRMPGGLHVRSQSVPVVPDLGGKREAVITNKFGTWGVGSKGVTEDWDEDFDFGDKATTTATANGYEEKRTDSMQPMAIPQKIKEHQISVMNNISLVREFGLMIEELKILKPRATSLGLIEQADDDLYELVDSMIELADQEADVPNEHQSPPSSPGIDMSEFDDPSTVRAAKTNGLNINSNDRHDTVIRTPQSTKVKRKTVLPDENDVFTSPATHAENSKPSTPHQLETISRPRKDSEAMARSVIEALKKKKSDVEAAAMSLQPVPTTRRVQFDTRTLRHIVPYVSGLVRRVKEQIRDAEHLDVDSESDWDAEVEPRVPPLAHVFNKEPSPIPESPASRRSRSIPKDGSPHVDDVSRKLKMMAVV